MAAQAPSGPPANMNQPPNTFHRVVPSNAVLEWNHLVASVNLPVISQLPSPLRPTESLLQRAILNAFCDAATSATAHRRALTT
jgi:hypothetical protein